MKAKHEETKRKKENSNMIETIDSLIKRLTVHPAAAAFPMLGAAEHKALKADIEQRGLVEPLVIMGDQLLDGRNRLKAAGELNITPKIVTYKGNDPVGEVISRNILRRHLTDDQRVAIVAKLRGEELAADAKKNQAAAKKGSKGGGKGEVSQRVADEAKVSGHKGRSAVAAAKHAPEELENVIAGKTKLASAAKKASAKKAEKDKAAGKVKPAKKEKSLRERVEAKFLRFLETFSVQEYAEVRKIVGELLTTTTSGKTNGNGAAPTGLAV